MAAIEIDCPECGAHIKAPARLAGKTGRCPGCKASVQIPDEVEEEDLEPDESDVEAEPEDAADQAHLVRAPRVQGPEQGVGLPFLGAVGGALVGGFLWSAISYVSGYELRYAALGFGLLVGAGCASLGGRGQVMASTCAVMALLAIGSGKFLSTYLVVNHEVDAVLTELATAEAYIELQRDAKGFAALPETPTADEVRDFMVKHDFTTSEEAADVAEQEVEEFISDVAPDLLSFTERNQTYPQWRNRIRMLMVADFSLIDTVTEDLDAIDLMFGFLGITTAFGVVMAASRSELEREARVRRYHPRGVRRGRLRG